MSEYIIKAADWAIDYKGESLFKGCEEVVRCRDCVAYEPYHTYAGMKLDYGECMQHRRQTNDERFCWWGKRSDR